MRSLVISTFMLAAVLAPAAAMAQSTAQQPPTQGTQPPTTTPPSGQQPATPPSGQQPAQQPAAPTPGRTFSADAGMLFNMIKPDKTADFEAIIAKVKDALAKSPNPVRKQQAAGWKVFKSVEPGMPLPDGTRAVLYIFYIDPAVKDADYTITKILAESFPSEVQDLYTKLVACYPQQGGQSIVNLQLVGTMTQAPGGAGGGK
ncbi:MAG TPA: hypothetical protein VL484_04745 [Vicinamibacterales bacterium]|jgi:hypothetical protein|nr:hypothetical protein [Vicinamibacterales bacterium]